MNFMSFAIFTFGKKISSDLPIKEEDPPQLDQELMSSHLSVSFPLVKLLSQLLEKSNQMKLEFF
jgi:hypothetical protein